MIQCIKEIQTRQKIEHNHNHSIGHINAPQTARGLTDLGPQLALYRSRTFCAENLHRTYTMSSQQSHKQHHNAHTAQPMGKTAPHQDAAGRPFYIIQDRSAYRSQTGHRLKKRIGYRVKCSRPKIRNHGSQGHHKPTVGHQCVILP